MAVAGARHAHELGFDGPGERRATVAGENVIGAFLVDVFGVDEQAVHVEDARPDRGEADGEGSQFLRCLSFNCEEGHTFSRGEPSGLNLGGPMLGCR